MFFENTSLNEDKFDRVALEQKDVAQDVLELKQLGLPIKYLDWAIQQLKKREHHIVQFDNKHLVYYLKLFEQALPKLQNKDITSYSLLQLLTVLHDLQTKESSIVKPQIKDVYSQGNYRIIQLLNEAAAKKYGKGTKWCISGENDNKFNEYCETSKFYVIFDLQNKQRYALQFDDDGDVHFWDQVDNEVSHMDLSKIFPDEQIQNAIMDLTQNDSLFDF